MSTRDSLRKIGLGRTAYQLWHAPVAAVRKSIDAGGPLAQWIDARGHREMRRAAESMHTRAGALASEFPEVHFLTGKRFWDQTAFCLHSMQHHSGSAFRTVFHDDGSFDEQTIAHLHRLFPEAEIRRRADTDARLLELLPPGKFPWLHDRRRHYPNILKLTDVHAGATGWRLVLDSDMLFFRRPDYLLSWLGAPDRPLHMTDIGDAYGYPRELLDRLAGAPVPSCVNVGLIGLQSEALDWERLEYWCQQLIETHGTSYYLEQALSAMLLAGRECAIAPRPDYLLMPEVTECRQPHAVLHHYVAGSKRGYFRHAWRLIP